MCLALSTDTPSSADDICGSFLGEWATKVGTAVHMIKQCFLHPLCCHSLTITGAGICFSKPSRLALFSGAVLNFSRNTVILGQFLACVWSVLHTFAVQFSVLVYGHCHNTWLSLTMASKQVWPTVLVHNSIMFHRISQHTICTHTYLW